MNKQSVAGLVRWGVMLLLAAVLSACGGGGGSAGVTTVADQNKGGVLTIALFDPAGTASNVVTSAAPLTVRAKFTQPNGTALTNTVVNFSSSGAAVTMSPSSGAVLTDSGGFASITIAPVGTNYQAGTAGTISASATAPDRTSVNSNTVTFQYGQPPVPAGGLLSISLLDASGAVSNIVTRTAPLTVRARFTQTNGVALSNTIVNFVPSGAAVTMSPSGGSVLTDTNGIAVITFVPATSNFQEGTAGSILASATAPDKSVVTSASLAFKYGKPPVATSPTLVLSLVDANGAAKSTLNSDSPLTAKATLLDANGKPLVGKVVNFSSVGAALTMTPSSGAVLTDSSGVASVRIVPSNPTFQNGDAGSVTARTTLDDQSTLTSNSMNYQFLRTPGAISLDISLMDQNGNQSGTLGNTAPLTAKAVFTDATGKPLAGKVVTFTFDGAGLTMAPASGKVATNASGVASITVVPSNPDFQSGEVGKIKAAAVADDGRTISSAEVLYQFSAPVVVVSNLVLSLTDTTGAAKNSVTATSPLKAWARFSDSTGKALSGKIVTFSTTGALVTMTPSSGRVLTDSNGLATVTFAPAVGSAYQAGDAGSISASAQTDSGKTVTSNAATFQMGTAVVAASDTLTLALLGPSGTASNSITSTAPLTARAMFADASGKPLTNKRVQFATAGAGVKMTPTSGMVLTDSEGVASVTLSPASDTYQTGDAGAVSATAQSDSNVTIISNSVTYQMGVVVPTPVERLILTLVDSTGAASNTLTAGSPLVARAVLTNTAGQPMAGKMVRFSGAGAAVSFISPASGQVLTDSAGLAIISFIPASTNYQAGDAGLMTASASLEAKTVLSNSMTFKMGAPPTVPVDTLSLTLLDAATDVPKGTVTNTAPLKARARFADSAGKPLAGKIVTFSAAGASITFTPASGKALTDTNGYATVTFVPTNPNYQQGDPGSISASADNDSGKTIVSNLATYQLGTPGAIPVNNLVISLLDASGAPLTVVTSTAPLTARAKFIDANGQPLAGKVVTFSSIGAAITFTPASGRILTDAAGVAAVTFVPTNANYQLGDAGSVSAIGLLDDGKSVASNSVTYQLGAVSPVPTNTLELALLDSTGASKTTVTNTSPLTARARLIDPNGRPLAGKVVTFTSTGAAITFSPSSATVLTDASGLAIVTFVPASQNYQVGDAGTVAATASLGATSSVGSNIMTFQLGAIGTIPVNNLNLTLLNSSGAASHVVTSVAPLTAKAVFTDSSGLPVSRTVVTFGFNGAAITMTPLTGQVLTDASGAATITFVPASVNYQLGDAGTMNARLTTADNKVITSNLVTYQLGAVVPVPVNTLDLTLVDSGGTAKSTVTSGAPLTARARFRDPTGLPLSGKVVSFTQSGAAVTMTPASGRALTDASGLATITFIPASINYQQGDPGTITATGDTGSGLTITSNPANFTFGAATGVGVPSMSLSLVNSAGVETSSLSSGSPIIARAKFVDATGLGLAGKIVSFTGNGAAVRFTPSSGKVLTDATGLATISFVPANLNYQAGDAGSVIAVGNTDDGKTVSSSEKTFQLGTADISLKLVSPASSPVAINAYGTTLIAVDVYVSGKVYTDQPVTVNLSSSSCVALGKASLSSSVQTINGRAQAVYTDIGCGQSDTVTATVAGSAVPVSAVVSIAPPQIASIQSVSAIPADKSIVIKGAGGSGRTETAILTFKVLDTAGKPVANQTVNFSVFSTKTVTLTTTSALTDTLGQVLATVNSGTEPTTFRVLAQIPGGASTISDTITVTTGTAVQAAMSLSASAYNFSGWEVDNQKVDLTVLLADQFGNPVADGTPVVFQTDSGAVGTSQSPGGGCITTNGGCTVQLRSQNPRYGIGNSAGKRAGLATVNVSTTTSSATLTGALGVFLSGNDAVNVYMGDLKLGSTTDFGTVNFCSGSFSIEVNDVNLNPMPAGTQLSGVDADAMAVQGVYPSTVASIGPRDASGVSTLVVGSMATRQGTSHLVKFKFPDPASPPESGSKTCVVGGPKTTVGKFGVLIKTPFGAGTLYNFQFTYPSP